MLREEFAYKWIEIFEARDINFILDSAQQFSNSAERN